MKPSLAAVKPLEAILSATASLGPITVTNMASFHLNNLKVSPGDGLTEFGRAMQELQIQMICANTPQAKGRVERANQTLQDHLTKEMRLQGISTPEQANSWLPTFIEDYNRRFAIPPRTPVDAHRPFGDADQLDRILCRKAEASCPNT